LAQYAFRAVEIFALAAALITLGGIITVRRCVIGTGGAASGL
jgi:hypothetical protein